MPGALSGPWHLLPPPVSRRRYVPARDSITAGYSLADPDVVRSKFFRGVSPYLFQPDRLEDRFVPFANALRVALPKRREWPVLVECDGPGSLRLYHALRRMCPWECLVVWTFACELGRARGVRIAGGDMLGEVSVTVKGVDVPSSDGVDQWEWEREWRS